MRKKLEEDIPNKINDVLGFVADVRCLEKNGKSYVEIVVPPMATAISYKNKFYYRSGTVTLELTGSSLHTFLLERIGGRWDSQPVEGVTIEELDRESFDIFRREAIRSRRMSRQDVEIPNEELLEKLHLLTDDGRLTRAAVMLFHREPEKWVPECYCKVAKFGKGGDLRYHDEVHGSLMIQADRMPELIFTKYLIPHIHYDNMTRVEIYPYDRDAVREGFFNALMHNYYLDSCAIQIRINLDAMWISNDLAFNSPWTPETLMAPHKSKPSNPLLANTFFMAGYVERWGRGIEEMCRYSLEYGCPQPYYQETPGGIMLVMPAHPDTIALQSGEIPTSQILQDTLQDNEDALQDILSFIYGNPRCRYDDLASFFMVHRNTIKKRISTLKERGLLIREGSYKSGIWVVTKKGKKYIQDILQDNEDTLQDILQDILSFINRNPRCRYDDLASFFMVHRNTIKKRISTLKERGLLIREGSDKNGIWALTHLGKSLLASLVENKPDKDASITEP